MTCHICIHLYFFYLFVNIKMCKIDLSFWYFNCCESNKKLKDPFIKVESICIYVPIVDNFQYKEYSYLICLLY